MTISPQQPNKSVAPTQLVRDLTLTAEAPMAFCVRLLLQKLSLRVRQERLFELFGSDPRRMDIVDARNLMLRLGYTSTQKNIQNWRELEKNNLPALYVDTKQCAYVLLHSDKENIIAYNAEGSNELKVISTGGNLVFFQEAPNTERSSLLQKLLYRFRNRLVVLYGISFGISLLALVVPFYIRVTYNLVIPSESGFTGTGLYVGVVLLFLTDWALRQWRSREISNLVARIDALLGQQLMEKSLKLNADQISILGPSNFQSQRSNLNFLLGYLQGPLTTALLDCPFTVIYLAAIYLIAGPLVIIPIIFMGITTALVLILERYYHIATEMNLSGELGIAQAQEEIVRRFLEVKQSNLEWVWLQRLRGLSAQSTTAALLVNRQLGQLQVIVNTASQLAGTLTLAIGVSMAYSNPRDSAILGTLIASMFFVWRVFTPFQQLMNVVIRFRTMRKRFKKLDQFLKIRQISWTSSNHESQRLYGSVLLDSAASRIGRSSSLVLTRTSIAVDPGETVAITGKAGCGKSATLRVISQIYPLIGGTLLFDGRDYRQFDPDVIQSNIAFVMEKTELLPGTILSNLKAMNPDASFKIVCDILGDLKILNYLESLPEGLDTSINESNVYQLPHGVLRLLSLAQALIKDTPIILIDDLSQGLTPDQFQTFIDIFGTFRRSHITGRPRSVVIATDNKLVLEKVDQICILDKGVTSFQGTSEELRQRLEKSNQ